MSRWEFERVVVVGASAGGVESLLNMVADLPEDFAAPLLVVLHMAADAESHLPQLLSRYGPLPAKFAEDGERLQAGQIYIAPPGHHLLVQPGELSVTRGPTENRFRPSVDVLFRSAALAYGPAVVGVVLSGTLDDGSAGLWAVARRGGSAIVQDPAEATFKDMPLNALKRVGTAQVARLGELGGLLSRLVRQPPTGEQQMDETELRTLEVEVGVSSGTFQSEDVLQLGQPSHFSCPECHGNLLAIREGDSVRYRCHIGHAYSAATLLASLREAVGHNLEQAIRALEETSLLLRELGEEYFANGRSVDAEQSLDQAYETERQSQGLRDLSQQLKL